MTPLSELSNLSRSLHEAPPHHRQSAPPTAAAAGARAQPGASAPLHVRDAVQRPAGEREHRDLLVGVLAARLLGVALSGGVRGPAPPQAAHAAEPPADARTDDRASAGIRAWYDEKRYQSGPYAYGPDECGAVLDCVQGRGQARRQPLLSRRRRRSEAAASESVRGSHAVGVRMCEPCE